MPLDYSKWNHIDVSDDEDDTHPNIDTPSLFRWRHQARVEKMEKQEKEQKSHESAHRQNKIDLEAVEKRLAALKDSGDKAAIVDLKIRLEQLLEEKKVLDERAAELEKERRLTPWNVDTLSKEGFHKTIINSADTKYQTKSGAMTEDEKAEYQVEFNKKYKEEMKKFGMFRRSQDSMKFLLDNVHLVCEETANYLTLYCIELQIEEKGNLMQQVAHQVIVMQYILTLAKEMKLDPRACIRPFFSKFDSMDAQYRDAFTEELNGFIDRVRKRAEVRIQNAVKEYEEEERQKRLGPGGIDPVEVFESLPKEMQECFEKKDIPMLQKVISQMPEEDARYHMDRCVKSGLWVPDANAETDKPEDSEVYEVVDDEAAKQSSA